MDDAQLGRSIRAVRHRLGWRQADVAARAGVSAGLVGLLERGEAGRMTVAAVRRVSAALRVSVRWDAGFRGPELGWLRDADHARLAQLLALDLERHAWGVAPEVSYNRYGERGRIDLLAFHGVTRALLVVEIQTALVDVQETLGALDAKARLAANVARAVGWDPAIVVRALVVADGSTNRRRVAEHDRLFAALALRGHAAMRWLRRPDGSPAGILLFRALPNRNTADARRAGRQRIRPRRGASRSHSPPGEAGNDHGTV